MKLVTAAQMQSLDRRTIQEARVPSLTLMERAGVGTVTVMEQTFGPLRGIRIAIFCGKGHNGGDGLVIARHLLKRGARVTVWLLHPPKELAKDTQTMLNRLRRAGGARLIQHLTAAADCATALAASTYVVDALLGTGLSNPVRGLYAETIAAMNESGRPIVAVDLPSGLHADCGDRLGATVLATLTATYGAPKLGLFLGDGIDCAGTVHVIDIGIPSAYVEAVESSVSLLTREQVATHLPQRRRSAHKGSVGHVGIIAGAIGKTGAAALAAKAAARVGAGLVTIATPTSVQPTVASLLLEAMTVPMPETATQALSAAGVDALLAFAATRTAVAIGPGIGQDPDTADAVRRFLSSVTVPCVVDADALNAAAADPSLWARCTAPMIVTPHPGEMARLCGLARGSDVTRDRLGLARRVAKDYGVIVVLKGARTIIANPDGQAAINPTGNPGMATGGTGDVLTGTIAGLLAQGLSPWDAACTGTYLHGLAGDLAAQAIGAIGLIAGDVIEQLPHAYTSLRA